MHCHFFFREGGAEKSSAVLSILLDNLGYEVHIISVLNTIDYDYKGTLLNLGALKDKDASFFGTLKRFSFFKYLRNINLILLLIAGQDRVFSNNS